MAKRKKQTENQKAYQKERKRLLQAIHRAEKQGYIFPEDIVPVELKWSEVCDESGDNLMSESELDKIIMKKIGRRPSKSLL